MMRLICLLLLIGLLEGCCELKPHQQIYILAEKIEQKASPAEPVASTEPIEPLENSAPLSSPTIP
jgi:hypothetical protein